MENYLFGVKITNNPLRKKITLDYWNNEFYYEQKENGLGYVLISKGKDGILKTEDDISGIKTCPNNVYN